MSEKNNTTPTSIPGRGVKRKRPGNVTSNDIDDAGYKLTKPPVMKHLKLNKAEVVNIIKLVAERKNEISNARKTTADKPNEIIVLSDDEEVSPDIAFEQQMEPEIEVDVSIGDVQEKDPLAVESVLESLLRKEEEPIKGNKSLLGELLDSSYVPFACGKCGARFHLKTELTQHLKICKENPKPSVKFTCDKCHRAFKSPSLLNLHNCAPKSFQCDKCKQTFRCWGNLFYHKRPHVVTHRCDRCCKKFKSAHELNTHMTLNEQVGVHECPQCEEQYTTRHLLFYHMHTHKDCTYKCTICKKSLKSVEDLKEHSLQCGSEKTYKCRKCDLVFNNHQFFTAHRNSNVHRMPFKCDECNIRFQTKKDLSRHSDSHVYKIPSNNYQGEFENKNESDKRSKTFENARESFHHDHSHTQKPFKCSLCGEEFEVIRELTAHLRSHVRCNLCKRKFESTWALSVHVCPGQFNNYMVKFCCSKCDAVFCTLQRLFAHAKSTHYTEAQEPIFYCYTCKVIFKGHRLELHTSDNRCHVEQCSDLDELFKCNICKVTFAYSYESLIHKNVHMGNTLFDCDRCPSTFITDRHLKRHMYERHGVNDGAPRACVCNGEAGKCDNGSENSQSTSLGKPTDRFKGALIPETIRVHSDEHCDIEEYAEPENISVEGVQRFTDIEKQDNEGTKLASHSANLLDHFIPVTGSRSVALKSKNILKDRTFFPRTIFHFVWTEFPFPTLDNAPHNRREIFSAKTGPYCRYSTPYEAFTAIWDKILIERIVNETNKYAHRTIEFLKESKNLGEDSRLNLWTDTNIDELYIYLGIVLVTGMCLKSDIKEYWIDTNFSSVIGDLTQYMDFNRFLLLSTFLHFANSNVMDTMMRLTPPKAKVYKIDPIVRYLNRKFKKLYRLNQNIVIDESLARWNRCADVKKATGIRTCEVYDCRTGYLWGFLVERDSFDASSATPLVLRLLAGLQHKGHTVYTDESHSNPSLARLLKVGGFDCVGALRTPTRLAGDAGTARGCTSGDVDVLLWRDSGGLRAALSTYHGGSMCRAIREPATPLIAHDYSACTKAIEDKNRSLSMFPIERDWVRVWYKKLFMRLINVSAINSLILYKYFDISDDTIRRLAHHREFRTDLITAIFERHKSKSTSILKDLLLEQR